MNTLWELLTAKKFNTTWHVEILDPDLVEEKYKRPDYLKIHQAINQGLRVAPGLRIYQENDDANDTTSRSTPSQT